MAKRKKNLNFLDGSRKQTMGPWRNHNRFELCINAEEFYPAMLGAIDQAKKFVLLEMYLFESGPVASQFIKKFLEAANRNVSIFLLLDDFGCRALRTKERKQLRHDKIKIVYYNPLRYGALRRNLFRDHRKILVVDQEIAFVGGAGITDDFHTFTRKHPGWRETMVAIRGECVSDWIVAFNHVWQLYADIHLPLSVRSDNDNRNTVPGRVIYGWGSGRQSIKNSLLRRILSAKLTCWIATAYFVPSFKIRRALCRAAKRGVDVRLLLPGPISDHPAIRLAARRFYFNLLLAGVRIYEYQPRFMHQKVLLCDTWVSMGSSNIDRWNFRWNLEANQEVESQEFVDRVAIMLIEDFEQSQEYLLENWIRRHWIHRAQEWFWGQVDQFIERFIR